jgi:NADH-quinone oxidoreductase subunit L
MDHLFAVQYSYLIPLLPLLGAVIAGALGAKVLRGQSHWPIWIGVGASAVISFSLLFQMLALRNAGLHDLWVVKDWYTWIDADRFVAKAGSFFDPLTAVMLCVVTGVGFLITLFSAGYMKGEAGYFRFFAYLGLFIFAMTCLVMANNFVMLYLGWEGVGLCSYLLIGYYYERPSARDAAVKAFLVNRVGDFGFGLGIMLIWKVFHTVSYFSPDGHSGVLQMAMNPTGPQYQALKWIPFLLMLGAFGKSAQFPLHVWLPDAMEGPTPVSALIHAATMVTAGVYMIARCGTLFVGNPQATLTVAFIGCFSALFAATIALRQFDLKRVFAYSTISQLGYMFAGVGVLAPVAGVFHLVTHAFFKALLFLGSGVVMHAMAGELDMRKMSGLKRVLPWTNRFMLIGCLALAGFPFLSGFFSKDEIVAAVLRYNPWLGWSLLLTAFLTAYYTFRLYFRVFQGPLVVPPPPQEKPGVDHGQDQKHEEVHHHHEPMVMMLPLAVLALGAILVGYLNWPRVGLGEFLGDSPSLSGTYHLAGQGYLSGSIKSMAAGLGQTPPGTETESPFTSVMLLSGLLSIAGIALAYVVHLKNRGLAEKIANALRPITRMLEAKYWVDEFYQTYIVDSLHGLGEFFYAVDRYIVDGLVWMVGFVPQLSGFMLKLSVQRGYLQGYAMAMLLGIAAILILIFVG